MTSPFDTRSEASVTAQRLGTTKDGRPVNLYTLQGAGGVKMDVTNYGCKIMRLFLPDRFGNIKDCILGFNDAQGYENMDPYQGTVVGRYANRIAKGKFTLDGTEYTLPLNNEPGGIPCCLHGGPKGWDTVVWDAVPFQEADTVGVVFTMTSPDGDEGFPGEVKVKVTYTLTPENLWMVNYEATTDKATPINMTQHVFFNLKGEGEGTIRDHVLTLYCNKYCPVDAGLIPAGQPVFVDGTPFDFRAPYPIGQRLDADNEQLKIGKGYDHCFVLANPTRNGFPAKAATLYAPCTGRQVEVWTTEPAIQIYTGNYLGPSAVGKNGKPYYEYAGMALETQHYPDSPNHPEFPDTILRPGETYQSCTVFRFDVR